MAETFWTVKARAAVAHTPNDARQRSGDDLLCPPSREPGTYALVLESRSAIEIEVGRLGRIDFARPYYLYAGSALGAGGLAARIGRHLGSSPGRHWHIDYLKASADILEVWHVAGVARLECIWAKAASTLEGADPVPQFGSTDCRCHSHLMGFRERPSLPGFRRKLAARLRGSNVVFRFGAGDGAPLRRADDPRVSDALYG